MKKTTDNLCPKCNQEMRENRHKEITDKLLLKPYIFNRWFVCDGCRHVQHFEKYKVINKTRPEVINK